MVHVEDTYIFIYGMFAYKPCIQWILPSLHILMIINTCQRVYTHLDGLTRPLTSIISIYLPRCLYTPTSYSPSHTSSSTPHQYTAHTVVGEPPRLKCQMTQLQTWKFPMDTSIQTSRSLRFPDGTYQRVRRIGSKVMSRIQ